MVKTKAYELRKQQPDALQKQLKDLKTELAGLRVAQVNAGTPTKLGQIIVTRKSIARVLTVINQQRKTLMIRKFKQHKMKPLDLRPKLTRRLRQALKPHEKHAKTLRQLKHLRHFPQRKFAVKN